MRAGAAVTRVTFESLYPGVDSHVSVLNYWVEVLNSEDQYRNNSDPKRLFAPYLMLGDSHYKDDVDELLVFDITSNCIYPEDILWSVCNAPYGDIQQWKCGLTAESDEQQIQLNDLRIKYFAKILLSDIHIHKCEVVSEVRAYVNLPNDVKKKMRERVFERIKDRVRSAF
ncbi:hypothetical protein R6Q57_021676 [Mikania cordata]